MDTQRMLDARRLLTKWSEQASSVQMALHSSPSGNDCFFVQMAGVVGFKGEDEFAIIVSESVAAVIQLRDADVKHVLIEEEAELPQTVERYGSVLNLILSDGSECLMKELKTTASVQ